MNKSSRSRPAVFSPLEIRADWRELAENIGERRAGTAEELRAAEFIARRFAEAGLGNIALESFPCRSLRAAKAEVHERRRRRWHAVDARPLVGAPGTPGAVTGEIAWLELPENAARLRPGSLRGKIAAVFGSLPTSARVHRRLVAARPLAVIHVDDRLPFPWTKNDGVYPYWVRQHGMTTTLTVPYTQAWRWRRDGVRRLRVRVTVDLRAAKSQNVVAELPGTVPSLAPLILTAHHDTQCGNPGADDNASGVICLLALARALNGANLRRTVRFISFGTEEQLSVGSSAYVARHRAECARAGLVINFDSVASPLGHWAMFVAGSGGLTQYADRQLARCGLDVEVRPEIIPFSDHFPFNRVGVASLWFMRTNFPGGRWQHHSQHDTLENVSMGEVCRLLQAVRPLVTDLAGRLKWPFPKGIPAAQMTVVRRLGRELFGS